MVRPLRRPEDAPQSFSTDHRLLTTLIRARDRWGEWSFRVQTVYRSGAWHRFREWL